MTATCCVELIALIAATVMNLHTHVGVRRRTQGQLQLASESPGCCIR